MARVFEARIVSTCHRVGWGLWISGGALWITLQGWGKPGGYVDSGRGWSGDDLGKQTGVCVDWHRCVNGVTERAGEMWISYPQVVRTKSGVMTGISGVFPIIPSTTANTDYLYLFENVTC